MIAAISIVVVFMISVTAYVFKKSRDARIAETALAHAENTIAAEKLIVERKETNEKVSGTTTPNALDQLRKLGLLVEEPPTEPK